jgi:ureidoacrylate peracid hydrolase
MGSSSSADLARKVDPRHTALVVIDYQNDFVAEGGALDVAGMLSPALGAVEPAIAHLVALARAAGCRIVFVRCAYDRDLYLSEAFLEQARRSFKGGLYTEVPVCASGTWGADFAGAVRPLDGDIVVTKHRFGAFEGTDLDLILRVHGIRTIVVSGVVTHVCVESTVREAFFRDYSCVVPRDAVAGWQPQWHATSLEVMDWGFAEVLPTERLEQAWAKTAAVPDVDRPLDAGGTRG